MDIWISSCKKPVKCSHCEELIETGEPTVFGKLWLKHTEEGGEARRWVKNLRWHAQRKRDGQCCWLVAGLDYLAKNPPVDRRGGKSLMLPKDIREERLRILRTRARLVAKLRELMLAPLNQKDTDQIIAIGSRIEEMKERIQNFGGPPKTWE